VISQFLSFYILLLGLILIFLIEYGFINGFYYLVYFFGFDFSFETWIIYLTVPIFWMLYLYWCKWIKSKNLLTTNITKFCRYGGSQMMVYFSYWLFVGIIVGFSIFFTALSYIVIHDFDKISDDKSIFIFLFYIIPYPLVMLLNFYWLANILKKN
jgi:hypothetical protein